MNDLPELPARSGPEFPSAINVSELIKGGLVDAEGDRVVSRTEQLDTDYLRGFLHGVANRRRNTSGTGTHRADPRGARVPQMGIDQQQQYGAAFRAIENFTRDIEEIAKIGSQAAQLAHDGLTSGALAPDRNSTKQSKNKREGDE